MANIHASTHQYDDTDIIYIRLEALEKRMDLLERMFSMPVSTPGRMSSHAQPQGQAPEQTNEQIMLRELLEEVRAMKADHVVSAVYGGTGTQDSESAYAAAAACDAPMNKKAARRGTVA